MKTFIAFIMFAGLLTLEPGSCLRAHERPGDKPILLSAKVNCPFVSDRGETIYLQLSLRTPSIEKPRHRPLNVAVVLDRSGSMGDERKIDFAKSALTSLINQLSPNDILSVVIYDDIVEVLRPAGKVGDKRALCRLVEGISPRGSTNLGGGMLEGYEQVSKYASKECTNRVILLSDGLANQGITDPKQLNAIARRKRAHAISLSTMGVGLEYNENLMVGLAEHGGGNYYFIEHPRSIAHILNREFESLSTMLAQNASLSIELGHNVRVLDVIGYEWSVADSRCSIALGDLPSDNTSEITVALAVPGGSGTLPLASGKLDYESEMSFLQDRPTFSTSIAYTARQEIIEEHRDMDAQARADVAVSTRKVERAMEMLDAGKSDDAEKELLEAKSVLNASPAASAAGAGEQIRDQAARLGTFQSLLKDSTDSRKAKKAIQYHNYRTQKNQQ